MAWGPLKSLNPSVTDIRRVVLNCEKQRFTLKPDPMLSPPPPTDSTNPVHWIIRANQGHSVAVKSESMLAPIVVPQDLPDKVLHGTFFYFWALIVESGGLRRMNRAHIHCCTGTPEDGNVGMRKDAQLIIEIDAARAMKEEGIRWYKSDNGYVLTEGNQEGMVPIKYFKNVWGRLQDVGTLARNGEIVGLLPDGLKANIPLGKGRLGKGERRGKVRGDSEE